MRTRCRERVDADADHIKIRDELRARHDDGLIWVVREKLAERVPAESYRDDPIDVTNGLDVIADECRDIAGVRST